MCIHWGLRRRFLASAVVFSMLLFVAHAARGEETQVGGPTDPKARKTFAGAIEWQKKGEDALAMDAFRKANKQDGGHCAVCLKRAYELALGIGDYRAAVSVVQDWLPVTQSDSERAVLHFWMGMALLREAVAEKKEKCFNESCDEFKTALTLDPTLTGVHYGYGLSLAYLKQDDAARTEFKSFLAQDQQDLELHARALRFAERVELARARMAPAFTVTTLDGQQVSMDSLVGKVVLIDFWATWCAPCRQALPHMRKIVKQFQGQPFVVLSVSLDSDAGKWKDFVGKNEMPWLQYRDGGFTGALARRFNVDAIPATFSIDPDGVLQDQHVGDADIENKLKKMIARAMEERSQKRPAAQEKANGSGN